MNLIFKFLCICLFIELIRAEQTLQCGDWNKFIDEKCFKVFDNSVLKTYDDAKTTCFLNEESSLVSIHSQDEQNFLFNLVYNVHKIVNDVWIGGNYKEKNINWSDNTTVNYTNWANENPRNDSGYDCVIMRIEEPIHGKWLNEPCVKMNSIVCQRTQNWLFSYLQKTVMDLRETVKNLTKSLEITKQELEIKLKNSDEDLNVTKSQLNQMISESTPTATISFFANKTAPLGWLKANGQNVSRDKYKNLFATIGTTFGSGDGSNSFSLPDLRGEFIRSWSDNRDVDAGRTFGSFQWGSSIPFAGYIENLADFAAATGFRDRWEFSGSTFDGGHHYASHGDFVAGVSYPYANETYKNAIRYVNAPNSGYVTNWLVLQGTRPRNIALLACIKY